ncbi:MAG: CoA transferase [Pseudomonadota bacterium]
MSTAQTDGAQMDGAQAGPLSGLRVLDFGHYLAGPLAGLFLADQGAEVIQVVRPGVAVWDANTEFTLARGKRKLVADLANPVQRQAMLDLAVSCDVVLENFRPGVMDRLGLGYDAISALNPGVIYVSMPAYSRHDPRAHLPAWDGTISAACGLFTDLSIGGAALDLPPTFTPLPLPSIYAGLWGAIAAVAAVHARQQHGQGDHIEVPLLDAAMSASAGVIFQVAGQPARYNAPPLSRALLDRISLRRLPHGLAGRVHQLVTSQMPPLFRNYRCGDGEQLFICAIDNANHIGKLIDALGIRAQVEALGLVFGDVLDIPPTRNNINAYRGNSAAWRGLRKLLASHFARDTADAWTERLALAGVPVVRQRSMVEWLNLPVMHESAVLVRRDGVTEPAPQVDVRGRGCATAMDARVFAADVVVSGWLSEPFFKDVGNPALGERQAPLAGIQVLDLANVIAGPSAGRTLAELGAEVAHVSAVSPRMGPRMNLLLGMEVNQGKRSIALDLHREAGRGVIRRLIPSADVLIYNKLPQQARRLGVAPDQVHALNARTVVTAVTAYGGARAGGWESRPAYDPVIQALTGIMQRFGSEKVPAVHGIASCIDYFTGYAAAFATVVGLVARNRGATHLVARTSLVRTAGWVQLPQVCNPARLTPTGLTSVGGEVLDRLYRARDGWVHVDAGPRGRMLDMPADAAQARNWLADGIAGQSMAEALLWLRSLGLVADAVVSARALRRHAGVALARGSRMSPLQASGEIVQVEHPAGESYFAPDASWLRFKHAPRRRIEHAPKPGQHSAEILARAGYSESLSVALMQQGVVSAGWPGLHGYIPE